MIAKTIFQVALLNPYHSMVPKGFYDAKKGHTGVDLAFKKGDVLLSPLSGTVVKILLQQEMGKCLYLRHDATGDIYVFAHNDSCLLGVGDKVQRLEPLVVTGDTGSKVTINPITKKKAAHSHFEGISLKPITDPKEGGAAINKIMSRSLAGYVGFNFDPLLRIKAIYARYGIDPITGKQAVAAVPHNQKGF